MIVDGHARRVEPVNRSPSPELVALLAPRVQRHSSCDAIWTLASVHESLAHGVQVHHAIPVDGVRWTGRSLNEGIVLVDDTRVEVLGVVTLAAADEELLQTLV